MIIHRSTASFYSEIKVYNDVPQIEALKCLSEIPLVLDVGTVVEFVCRCTATNDDLAERGKNASWILRTRIEPTTEEDWGLNIDPENGNDDYCVLGQIGFKHNGNITPDMHHSSREISDIWAVTASGVWFFKLCSRSHGTNVLPTDRLKIDRVELQVIVH